MSLSKISSKVRVGGWYAVLYAGLIAITFFLWRSIETPIIIKGDVIGYIDYAYNLINNHYEKIAYALRSYGYPVFLAVVIQGANFLNLSTFYPLLFAVQFAVHIITAWITTFISKRLLNLNWRHWILPVVFVSVAWNPSLLAMITQPLTENLTVFWITLLFYVIQSYFIHPNKISSALIGLVLGLATVTRPFHLVWGIGLVILFIMVYLWDMWHKKHISVRRFVVCLSLIVISFGFTTLTQTLVAEFAKLYAWSEASQVQTDYIQKHLNASLYSYRYETFYILSTDTALVKYYINPRLYPHATGFEIGLMPFIKLISMFQQHDVKIYRTETGIVSPIAFAAGLILWAMFCYVISQGIYELWQAWKKHLSFPLSVLSLFLVLGYVSAYALFTVTETRFIFPIFPMLIGLFVYYASQSTHRWTFLISISFAIVTYGLTLYTLLSVF